MKVSKFDDRIQFKTTKVTKEVFEEAVATMYGKDMSDYLRDIVSSVIREYQEHKKVQ